MSVTVQRGGGAGDVVGPASATDKALAVWDGTTGKLVKNSVPTVETTGIDFKNLQAIAMVCDKGTSFPSTGLAAGQWFYRSDIKTLFIYEAAWKAIISFGTVSLYVNKASGSDTVGQGYSSGAGATSTIQYAVDLIPPIIGGNVTISVAVGTYAEEVTVQGKAASGNYAIFIAGTLPTATLATTAMTSAAQYANGAAGSGATQATIVKTAAGWGVNAYAGMLCKIDTTTAQWMWIESNTADTLTMVGKFTGTTPTTQNITIYDLDTSATFIHGTTGTRNYGINNLNVGVEVFISNIKFYDFLLNGVHGSNGSFTTVTASKFRDSTAGGYGAQQILIDGLSKCCFQSLWLDSRSKTRNGSIKVVQSSVVQSANLVYGQVSGSTTNVNMYLTGGSGTASHGYLLAQNAQQLDIPNGWVIRSVTGNGVFVTAFSRGDISDAIVKSCSSPGISVSQSTVLIRGIMDVSSNTGAGIVIANGSTLSVVDTATTQINNNTTYGVDVDGSSPAPAVTAVSYTTNTLAPWIYRSPPSRLLGIKYAADMVAGAGPTTIFTTDASTITRITGVIVRDPSATLAGGTSFSFTNFRQTVDLSSLTATTDFIHLDGNNAKYTEVPASTAITITNTTGSAGAATATIEVYGYTAAT